MIKLFFIPGLIVLSCGSVKSNQSAAKTDSISVPVPAEQIVKDTSNEQSSSSDIAAVPTCIKNKINSFKKMPKHEQPQSVTEYMYRGKKVYYIVMPCCDFFSEVYDGKCKFLGSPDGGITGKGDGKLPDFMKEASKAKLIWKAVN